MITVSTRRCPAPMLSSLSESYGRQIHSLADTLNNLNGTGTIHCFDFGTIAQFAEQIQTLIERSHRNLGRVTMPKPSNKSKSLLPKEDQQVEANSN